MIIGITGGLGSGKTTVSGMFRRMGAYVIDADKVCHSLTAPTKKVYRRIVANFGRDVLGKNKEIDRKKLAGIVFKDASKLRLLNGLVHPEAIRKIEKMIREKKNRKTIVVDAALIVESLFYKKMDKLIVVKAGLDKRVKRLIQKNGMTRKEILQRTRMQAPVRKKLALADFIIDNSGSRTKTKIQVERIWKQLGVAHGCK